MSKSQIGTFSIGIKKDGKMTRQVRVKPYQRKAKHVTVKGHLAKHRKHLNYA